MSFLDPTPAEAEEYRRRAAMGVTAADLLIVLRRRSLDRRLNEIVMEISTAERAGAGDIESLAESHMELLLRKTAFESEEGREALRMEIVTELFARELSA